MRQLGYAATIAKEGRLVALFKQGINEIPEVMFAGAGFIGMSAISILAYSLCDKEKLNNRQYKMYPVYMRPDDPRVPLVHKP